MPYIKLQDRPKFKELIENVLHVIQDGNESNLTKGEYFGFLVTRITKRFIGDPEYTSPTFNSNFFNQEKLKHLTSYSDKLSAMLNRSEPLEAAGEMNYVITSIYWGLLGWSKGAPSDAGRYGHRAYLRGILEVIQQNVEVSNTGSQSDRTMAFRRWLVTKGVLSDVVTEAYRRLTADYEDQKIKDNFDIWSLQGLITE